MNATHKKVLLAAYALSLFVISINLLIEDWLNGNSLINALKGVQKQAMPLLIHKVSKQLPAHMIKVLMEVKNPRS